MIYRARFGEHLRHVYPGVLLVLSSQKGVLMRRGVRLLLHARDDIERCEECALVYIARMRNAFEEGESLMLISPAYCSDPHRCRLPVSSERVRVSNLAQESCSRILLKNLAQDGRHACATSGAHCRRPRCLENVLSVSSEKGPVLTPSAQLVGHWG